MDKNEIARKYYLNNKEVILKKCKEYSKQNKNKIRDYKKKYYSTKHGKIMQALNNIKKRCNDINNKRYNRYGGRGIKNLLTYQDMSLLWDRDNASFLKKPSIDRVNIDGNYELSNCQFIEMKENSQKDCSVKVKQLTIDGELVREWNSIAETETEGFQRPNIIKCCKGLRKSHKGFLWSY